MRKDGLRKVRFHDLRHAFGSAAIKKLDPNTVQAYMRHAHYSTTQRYLHHKPRPDHARQLEEASRESNVLPFSGHARDTPQPRETPVIPQTSANAGKRERRRPESNRCTRLCRPLRSHSATAPCGWARQSSSPLLGPDSPCYPCASQGD